MTVDFYKMASAEFLEQALSTDVDQNAVNAIVGSLENQLVTSVSSTSSQNIILNGHPNQLSNLSTGGKVISVQKYNSDVNSGSGILTGIQSPTVLNSVASFNNVQSSIPTSFMSQTLTGAVSNSNDHIKVYSQPQNLNPNNPVSFPAQTLTNGCIGLSASPNQILHTVTGGSVLPQSINKTLAMQPPIVIKQGTNGGQVGMQTGMVTVPMSVNSSQQTIIPNVQLLNMRPGAPAVAAQKSVATVSPRVVIGAPQVVGTRAAAPGITLQTLQSLQPGQQGHLLLKTESGQYQLLRVGPAPTASTLTAPQAQTIRLSTVPAHPGVATVSTSVAAAPVQIPGTMPPGPVAAPVVLPPPASVSSPTLSPQPPTVTMQKPNDNTKEKCRNFLANLLDLSSKEPKSVEMNVRNLIQELIDAEVEPEEFCDRLEKLLNASPQPCLIGFLKRSLPLLRQSLVTKELIIEGINPPSPHVAFTVMPPVPTAQPVLGPANLQMPKPQVKSQNTIAVLQNIPVHTKINLNKVSSGKSMNSSSKGNFNRSASSSAALSTILTPGKSSYKDKEKKTLSHYSQPFGDDKMAGDDDINDVAAMGGVNLAEETQRILGSTELIGTQIRSCKDEYLVPMGSMQSRLRVATANHGLDEPSMEVAGLLSHALHERLKNLIEKLAVVAQHRIDLVKADARYEMTQDVKSQLKFLEELDKADKKRREDSEREMLMRAAKSRSKNEDPEQAKLKAKAKEMQRAELEELRQREANLTALQAIGPRKKPRLEGPGASGDSISNNGSAQNNSGFVGRSQLALRTRLKRINLRDMVLLLEQERETSHSQLLFRSYLK
ncbi:hypothetical protein ACJJTC_000750 [Scirpophaga incertulas]